MAPGVAALSVIPVTESGLDWLSVSTSTMSSRAPRSPAATVAAAPSSAAAVTSLKVMSPGRNWLTVASQPSAGTPVVLTRVTVIEPSAAVLFTVSASVSSVVIRLSSLASRPL